MAAAAAPQGALTERWLNDLPIHNTDSTVVPRVMNVLGTVLRARAWGGGNW